MMQTPCSITKTMKLHHQTDSADGLASADGSLWVLIPRDGSYAAPADPNGGYDLKVPFYRVDPGHLTVRIERVDGPGHGTVDMHESSYAPTGYLPTGPVVSDLGCWRISATQAGHHVAAVVRVTESKIGQPAG